MPVAVEAETGAVTCDFTGAGKVAVSGIMTLTVGAAATGALTGVITTGTVAAAGTTGALIVEVTTEGGEGQWQ